MGSELHWGPAQVHATEQLTATVRQLEILPASGAAVYSPGSHINVAVFVNDKQDFRSYSLVGDAPLNGAYRIAVRHQLDGRGGSSYMWRLKPGDRLSVSNPQNLFELSIGRPHYLLLAGGIGITPLVGMAQHLLRMNASFQLLYCGRCRADMAYCTELKKLLGGRLQLAISDEGARADLTATFAALPANTEVYFCGPIAMLEAARNVWRCLDRRAADFRFETFGSSGQFAREAFEVEVFDCGRMVTVPENLTMLDALENAGVPIMADCKRGECGICVVDVLSLEGKIDHRDVFLSAAQKREGRKMCVCVSRVVGGRVTIDSGFRPQPPGVQTPQTFV